MALRTIRWAVPAIGITALLSACASSDRPIAASRSPLVVTPAVAELTEAPHSYSGSSEPRVRHRTVIRHMRQHHEPQQAQADTVNPPFGAGE